MRRQTDHLFGYDEFNSLERLQMCDTKFVIRNVSVAKLQNRNVNSQDIFPTQTCGSISHIYVIQMLIN